MCVKSPVVKSKRPEPVKTHARRKIVFNENNNEVTSLTGCNNNATMAKSKVTRSRANLKGVLLRKDKDIAAQVVSNETVFDPCFKNVLAKELAVERRKANIENRGKQNSNNSQINSIKLLQVDKMPEPGNSKQGDGINLMVEQEEE